MSEDAVREIAEAVGASIKEMERLPDGSGFAVMSMPLPETHWIYGDPSVENKGDGWSFEPPPMLLRMGESEQILILRGENVATAMRVFQAREALNGKTIPQPMSRREVADLLRRAGKYAMRAATMKGKDMDFDPDALIRNLLTGMLGYCTPNGLDETDAWANPPHTPDQP